MNEDTRRIAHLMRRAGFGATRDEIEAYAAKGYEATVEELLDPPDPRWMGDFMARRFHHEQSGMMGPWGSGDNWLYRMITTTAPLVEKTALFWHGILATGYPKVIHGKMLSDQIRMFRRYGLGSFRTLLAELAKDPAMIVWLDNYDNHGDAINENFGRELLELFSMGVGNYSEQDIKECSRAFTGWTIGNTEYMVMRSERDSDWPYGRISWHFEYKENDHDGGEKEFLGRKGRFNGADIVDIICEEESTARFISRHMYHFFVADEPPVPRGPTLLPGTPRPSIRWWRPISTAGTTSSRCSGRSSRRTSSRPRTSGMRRSRVRRSSSPGSCGSRASSTGPAGRSWTGPSRWYTWAST